MQIILLGIALNCLVAGAAEPGLLKSHQEQGDKKERAIMSMHITSSSFPHNGVIPVRHTCDGHDTSPELFWTEVPEGAKSLVLIVDDPDAPDPAAPKRTWVHWVLYNIPANTAGLSEGIAATELPSGTRGGINDWQRTGYGGPCPPIGSHRYFHKLYALDTVLPDLKQPTKAKLEAAMQGHVIAYSELIGRYQKH
jgi:Raf kinase inhibitor-like YbhB/YbcL family protein